MGTKVKAGRRYIASGCSVSRTKGDAICDNRALVSELQLLAFVRDALKALPSSPAFQEGFLSAFGETLADRPVDDADPGLQDAYKAQQERVARIVDAISDAGGSPALTARLKDDELKLEALRTRVAATQTRRSRLAGIFMFAATS